jgi:predicted RNA-binding protein (virulence factor B family)
MVEIGKYNELNIVKEVPFGVYLEAEGFGEILLPGKYVPKDAKKGDLIKVFIYLDSEDRIIATTLEPTAIVGEYAWLKVVSNSKFGAFAAWGLEKDLFIPFREQRQEPVTGRSYLTYIYLDEHSGRIVGSHKYYKFLQPDLVELKEGDEVDVLVFERTPIGFKAIVANQMTGILYKNEVFDTKIQPGSRTKAFIKKMREDQKIDLTLHKPGYASVISFTDKILAKLNQNNGFLSITDKSSPELIYEFFGVSKKVFKKAIGSLYKERKILIQKDGIELVQKK